MVVEIAADQSAPAGPNLANGTTGWELALVTAPSSNESATADSKLVSFLIFICQIPELF